MKKKLKGLLSLWLAVVLVLGTPTVPVLAEGTDHEGYTNGWEILSSRGGVLAGNYYCNENVGLDRPVSVSTNCSATICLSGNNLFANNAKNNLVEKDGTLTMDDGAEIQGSCSLPFNVGGTLNLKRGKYSLGPGKEIKVLPGGELNIGDENGGTTQVQITYEQNEDVKSTIDGQFNLIVPDKNYKLVGEGENQTVQVFAWYIGTTWLDYDKGVEVEVNAEKFVASNSINDITVEKITDEALWKTAKENSSGVVHLYSKWAEGHTATLST